MPCFVRFYSLFDHKVLHFTQRHSIPTGYYKHSANSQVKKQSPSGENPPQDSNLRIDERKLYIHINKTPHVTWSVQRLYALIFWVFVLDSLLSIHQPSLPVPPAASEDSLLSRVSWECTGCIADSVDSKWFQSIQWIRQTTHCLGIYRPHQNYDGLVLLTLSLSRVIKFKFLLQPHQ